MSKIMIPDFIVNNTTPLLTLTENITWNLSDYRIDTLHQKGYKGKGVKIGVVDTGLAPHNDLKHVYGLDFTGTGLLDEHGHGTHVAGIIAALENNHGIRGIAPEARIDIYKVISRRTGSVKHLIEAIDRAIAEKCNILNMSLGIEVDIPDLKAACQRAHDAGILMICASGNSGNSLMSYPGAYDSCIAVGSVNRNKQVSAFTSHGQPLDVMAPGEKILSTYLDNGYAVLSGTSMAAPWVTGVCAMLIGAGVKVDYDLITSCTTDINDPGFDHKSGYGIFDPHKALLTLTPPEKEEEETSDEEMAEILNNMYGLLQRAIGLLK